VIAPPSYVEADSSGPAGECVVVEKRPAAGRLDWTAVRQLLDPPPPALPWPARESGPGKMTGRRLDAILAIVAGANTAGHWTDSVFWAACRLAEAGVPQAEAERLITDAAQPWNDHEARRVAQHVAGAYRTAAAS
jgi:hypothetical protein